MARLEKVIKDIVDMFVEYADDEGKLSKEELMKMLEKEIECTEMKEKMKAAKCEKKTERMGRDGEIDFSEFSRLVGFLAKCCYHKKTGKGKDCGGCSED
ncbi:repetin-like [Cottoperca gobio]|uniref:Repetin-like n=1 Tax=Cottoperca gobio TaxID=56716 RepID=A0A6J2RCC5_COTGO|nr:repetin-like [Cottoperca gobio]XP_029308493.1 repetin-like [Cottoperca gobio]